MTAPTLTEALALAIHKSRPSNEAPEFDMGVASRRAERIVAALPPALLAALDQAEAVVAALQELVTALGDDDGQTPWWRDEYNNARAALRAYEDADKVAALADVTGEETP